MTPTLSLPSDDTIPQVGLGFWKIADADVPRVVQEAIGLGYRHFDSACDYGNEAAVGEGLRQAFAKGLCRREEMWLTSKLWNTYHAAEHVRPAALRSMHDLGVDYLDLYMIHFPIALRYVPPEERYPPEWLFDPQATEPKMEPAAIALQETWQAMEELVREGLVRNIGVCNYNVALLRDLLNYASIRPAMLQVETHPFLTQEKLLRYCKAESIPYTAFSPLGALSYVPLGMAEETESPLGTSVIREIASRHEKSSAQIVLRWGVQRGTVVIPKSSRKEHLAENLALFDFSLSEEQMSQIASLSRNRRFNDPGVFCEQAFNTFFPIFD